MPDLTAVLAAYEECAPICRRPEHLQPTTVALLGLTGTVARAEHVNLALWREHVREWLWRQALGGHSALEVTRGMYGTTVYLETAYGRISTTSDTEDAAYQAAVKAIGGKR